MEGKTGGTRPTEQFDALLAQLQLDAADAPRVHDARNTSPSVDHPLPGLRTVDTAGGNRQSRSEGFYPPR